MGFRFRKDKFAFSFEAQQASNGSLLMYCPLPFASGR
jgi:hypothetical protein